MVGLIVIILIIKHIQAKEDIIPVLSQFDMAMLLPVFIFIFLHLGCLFIMWRTIILDIGKMNPRYGVLLHSFLGGRTLGFITPGNSGELLKGMFFTTGTRLKSTSLSMIHTGYSMLVRIVLGVLAVIYFFIKTPMAVKINIKLLVVLVLIAVVGMIILIKFKREKIEAYLDCFLPSLLVEFIHLFKTQLQGKSFIHFVTFLSMALAANLLVAMAFMVILAGFNIDVINIQGLMAFEAAYLITSLLPITPSGIGIREGSRVYFFALIGCNQTAVLCASIILFGLNIMVPALLGIGSLKYFWEKNSKE